MSSLVIAPSAEKDLNAIVDYIAFDLGNPEAANDFLDGIENAYDTLESMPNAFPCCKDAYLRANGYRQVGVKDYIMIYRIEDEDDIVRILHFYHGSQYYLSRLLSET